MQVGRAGHKRQAAMRVGGSKEGHLEIEGHLSQREAIEVGRVPVDNRVVVAGRAGLASRLARVPVRHQPALSPDFNSNRNHLALHRYLSRACLHFSPSPPISR
jgi:hypothetical protein